MGGQAAWAAWSEAGRGWASVRLHQCGDDVFWFGTQFLLHARSLQAHRPFANGRVLSTVSHLICYLRRHLVTLAATYYC